MTEWKTGEEAREHAQGFADELKALMSKYSAVLNLESTCYGYDYYYHEIYFEFKDCSYDVRCGTYTEGDDLVVK